MGHKLIISALFVATFLPKDCHFQGCGRAPLNPLIVGGADASPGNWPWQVYVSIPDPTGNFIYMCGGSLITQEWILTAAHCVYALSRFPVVYMGSISITDPNTVRREVVQKIIYYRYAPFTNLGNNIALLRMSRPVTFNNYIQPVCLAQKGSTFFTGDKAWIAGWGTTSEGGNVSAILQEVSVPIVGDKECKCKNSFFDVPPKTICAGYAEGGKDACQGDLGGPLVVKTGEVWVQTGIASSSFSYDCARPDKPRIYTEVSEFQDWIRSIVGTVDPPGFVTHTSTGIDSDKNYNCTDGLTAPTITTTTATTTTPGATATTTTPGATATTTTPGATATTTTPGATATTTSAAASTVGSAPAITTITTMFICLFLITLNL